MALFPNKHLTQVAVYWGTPVPNGSGGFTFAAPVEIICRWVRRRELITLNNGDQIISNARVQINQELDEEGLLFLGDLDTLTIQAEDGEILLTEAGDPLELEEANITSLWEERFRIRKLDNTPNIKGTRFYRRAWL